MTVLCTTLAFSPLAGRANNPAAAPMRPVAALWSLTADMQYWPLSRWDCWLDQQQFDKKNTLWLLGVNTLTGGGMSPSGMGAMEHLLSQADARDMKVIVDIANDPGQWTELDVNKSVAAGTNFLNWFYPTFGNHPSLWGWYLNYEIYIPIYGQPTFVNSVIPALANACKSTAPNMKVLMSPFFLLDSQSVRGFPYFTPAQYTSYWAGLLSSSQVDILMVQDSGEHLSFFTLNDRLPFWQAYKAACDQTGKTFWLNVEAGQCNVGSWDEYSQDLAAGYDPLADPQRWSVVPNAFFLDKLIRSKEFTTTDVSWGYFEFQKVGSCQ